VAYRALGSILQGLGPTVEAGEIIPDTYPDMHGESHPNDFERLVDLGAAEKVSAAEAKKAPAKD
jgi:hypothetical protein